MFKLLHLLVGLAWGLVALGASLMGLTTVLGISPDRKPQ